MGKIGYNNGSKAIVVGNSKDEFVQYTTNLLRDYRIDFVRYSNIYSATGELARNEHKGFFVIGRLEHLGREKGRFLQKLNEKRAGCCCFIDGGTAFKRSQVLAAMRIGAFIVSEPAEIREVITRLLTEDFETLRCKKENVKWPGFNKDKFIATDEELDALLGVNESLSELLKN